MQETRHAHRVNVCMAYGHCWAAEADADALRSACGRRAMPSGSQGKHGCRWRGDCMSVGRPHGLLLTQENEGSCRWLQVTLKHTDYGRYTTIRRAPGAARNGAARLLAPSRSRWGVDGRSDRCAFKSPWRGRGFNGFGYLIDPERRTELCLVC